MPFVKTEVDIHEDYSVQAVDAGVAEAGREVPEAPDARPRQLHPVPGVRGRLPVERDLDDEPRHRRGRAGRAPWRPTSTARTRSSWSTTTPAPAARCAWSAARRDVLYYARLPEGDGGARAMAAVPMSQQADEDAE